MIVASPELLMNNAPLPGSILTVKYDTINHLGKLSLNHFAPAYMRVRPDLVWSELQSQYQQDIKNSVTH